MKLLALLPVAAGVAFAVRLALSTPVSIYSYGFYDDQHYIERAGDLAAGRWLGPYTQRTLMKGPGFPALLAASARLGLTSTIGLALVHLLACALVGFAVARLAVSWWPGMAATLLLALHPFGMTQPLLRLARDSVYSDQVLLFLALLALAATAKGAAARCAWGFAGGLVLAWAWLTREEGFWLLPGLALGFAFLLIGDAKARRFSRSAAVAAAAGAGCAALFALLAWRNSLAYGAWVGVEFNDASFRRALGALERVESGGTIPYVPVSRATRERIYALSPAFAELREGLDPASGPVWQWGCPVYPSTCGEIAGGWFVWALREAAWKAGEHGSPERARVFFDRLAGEVGVACASGALRCRPAWMRGLPRIERSQLAPLPGLLGKAVGLLVLAPPPPVDAAPSDGRREVYEQARRTLGYPLVTPLDDDRSRIEARGWFYARDGAWPSVEWIDGGGVRSEVALRHGDSRQLARRMQDPTATNRRFRFVVQRDLRGSIVFRSGRAKRTFAVREILERRGEWRLGSGILHLDSVLDLGDPALDDPSVAASRRWRQRLLALYRIVLPPLLGAGILALPIAARRWRRGERAVPPLAAASVLWALVASRVVLLALVDISAFPAMHYLYFGPAPALAAAASMLALVAATAQSRDGMSSSPPRNAVNAS